MFLDKIIKLIIYMSFILAQKDPYEYTVRDYSAIDKQINEIANRESVLTSKLKQENLRKLATHTPPGLKQKLWKTGTQTPQN